MGRSCNSAFYLCKKYILETPFAITPCSFALEIQEVSEGHSLPILLSQQGSYLKLSTGHFEGQLSHAASCPPCSIAGVQLIPNGVTIHLDPVGDKEDVQSTERALWLHFCTQQQINPRYGLMVYAHKHTYNLPGDRVGENQWKSCWTPSLVLDQGDFFFREGFFSGLSDQINCQIQHYDMDILSFEGKSERCSPWHATRARS